MPWPQMVDLAITDDDMAEAMEAIVPASRERYPSGLCIQLTARELEKLNLDTDVDVDDMIYMRVSGDVTRVDEGVSDCTVYIQIKRISVLGSEEAESAEEEAAEERAPQRRRYRKG